MAFSLALTQAVHTFVLIRDKNARGILELVPASHIAETLGIPKPSVVKILAALGQAGLLESGTGVRGGVRLAPGAGDRTLLDLFEAVEGRQPLFRSDPGFSASGGRAGEARRAVADQWSRIDARFRADLATVRLADLAPDGGV